ncbi:MAG: chemotaxis protein CheW [Prolixibacteraceae bacterium]|jgi:purine-binding chemotaxis protein CheW
MAVEIVHGLNSFFTFRIEGELFAVNVGNIVKILAYSEATKIPNSPSYFKGVLNLFGDVLPIFDGRLKFGFQEKQRTRETCIVVFAFELEGQILNAGIVVDSVEKIVNTTADQVLATEGNKLTPDYIFGTFTLNDETIGVLDLEKIFGEEEIRLTKL